MLTIVSVLLALVVLFGVSVIVGRVGGFHNAERRAAASGDRELLQALRKEQSDMALRKARSDILRGDSGW